MIAKFKISRLLRLLIYLFIMGWMVFYGQKYHPGVTYAQCISNPVKYAGTLVEIGTEATIYQVFQEYFVISQMQHRIKVLGPAPENAAIGEFVTLSGIFQQDGSISPISCRIAEKRRQKIWVSILPMLFIFLLFIICFKWNWKLLRFETRNA